MSAASDVLEITAPQQQDGTKATVAKWLKEAGARVAKDEPVLELETDKVVVEVPAPGAGVLEVVMAAGADAQPGSLLGRVHATLTSSAEVRPANAVVGLRIEDAAENDLVPGRKLPNVHGGNSSAQSAYVLQNAGVSATTSGVAHPSHTESRSSPSVRRLVAEHGLNLAALSGSGRDGRVTRTDVMAAIEARAPEQGAPSPSPGVNAARAAIRDAAVGEGRAANQLGLQSVRIPHNTMRRRIAENMLRSVSTAPHVTSVFEADFSAISAHRQVHKAQFAAEGVKLTFTAYFVAASVQAMLAAPAVNSRWHDDFLEVFGDVNVGVGTALADKGLIVPVVHKAQELSLLGIAARLQDLAERARNGKLKSDDVQGGTFTISNHGVSGSLLATPIIINQPQSAILGIGAMEKRVVVREVEGIDTIQIRPMAYVSLSIDHRVIDGAQTNAWLSRFVEIINGWPR